MHGMGLTMREMEVIIHEMGLAVRRLKFAETGNERLLNQHDICYCMAITFLICVVFGVHL